MSGKTSIQWTAGDDGTPGVTWNPSIGCARVSAGCDHCYAFQLHDQRHVAWKRGRFPSAPAQYHQPFSKVELLPRRLEDPLHWRKPRRVFVDSMSDLFHKDVPDDFIARIFAVMSIATWHTFQILTKRPERMRDLVASQTFVDAVDAHVNVIGRAHDWICVNEVNQWPLPNVWLGVSVEDQAAADKRIPAVLETPAAVRFLSCEPLLGPLDLSPWLRLGWVCELCYRRIPDRRLPDDWSLVWQSAVCPECSARLLAAGGKVAHARGGEYATSPDPRPFTPDIHWCIFGGESGTHARPMDLAWVRDLLAQCGEADVAPFVKQLGTVWARAHSLMDRHGGAMGEWPPDLQIREYPAHLGAREEVSAWRG